MEGIPRLYAVSDPLSEPMELIWRAQPQECVQCKCPNKVKKLGELAFWVAEGRLTVEKATDLLREKIGCTVVRKVTVREVYETSRDAADEQGINWLDDKRFPRTVQ